jgi:hypothetical protein
MFLRVYAAMVIAVVAPPSQGYHFDNYLIYGMRVTEIQQADSNKSEVSLPSPEAGKSNSSEPQLLGSNRNSDEVIRYGRGTIAVSVTAFVGAYFWTLIFLARRVTNFDLSPFSFLRATIQICLAAFVCVFLRHLYDSVSQVIWQTTSSSQNISPTTSIWLLALASLIGFYPALG